MKKSILFVNLVLAFIFLGIVSIFQPIIATYTDTEQAQNYKLIRNAFSFFTFSSPTLSPPSNTSQSLVVSPIPSSAPGSTNQNKGQQVENLVAQININCQDGVVTKFNESCLSKIILNLRPLDDSTVNQLKPSTNICSSPACDFLQCVRLVKASVLLVGRVFDTFGNAIQYRSQNKWPTGFQFIDKSVGQIKPGDLPIWNVGIDGHIAYVTKNIGTKWFMVAEANFDKPGHVRIYPKSLDDPRLLGWLSQN